MYTETKARLSLVISAEADDKLRKLVFDHRKTSNISEIVDAMIHHCVGNRAFTAKLTKKEEDCEI
jgi:hypothetical protein